MKSDGNKKIVYTGLCIAIGLILPQFIKIIPLSNPGSILLPMHIPVLLCGLSYGAFCGMILPLLASSLTGMPQFFPIGISMMFEPCAYGGLSGLLYRLTKGKTFPTLIQYLFYIALTINSIQLANFAFLMTGFNHISILHNK